VRVSGIKTPVHHARFRVSNPDACAGFDCRVGRDIQEAGGETGVAHHGDEYAVDFSN